MEIESNKELKLIIIRKLFLWYMMVIKSRSRAHNMKYTTHKNVRLSFCQDTTCVLYLNIVHTKTFFLPIDNNDQY